MIESPPASEIIGVLALAATSSAASEVGVSEGPTITSTLFSDISLVAFLAAVVVSDASFSTVTFNFWPAISVGHSLTVFCSGMPSVAPGPVVETITPMLMSACALRVKAIATATAASLWIDFMKAPLE